MENFAEEPEEIVERNLVAIIAAIVTDIPVEGVLTPAAEGEVKVSHDTFINVTIDEKEQTVDQASDTTMFEFAAKVTVHFAFADDKSGHDFRDTCRKVRHALKTVLGDGCALLNGDGFEADGFMLGETNTDEEGDDDSPGMQKTYNATISGRTTPNNERNN